MDERGARSRLRTSWRLLVAAFLAGLALAGTGLRRYLPTVDVWRWAALSGVVLVYQLAFVRRRLDLNRDHRGTLFPTWGVGNAISLFRGWLIGLLAGFVLLPRGEDLAAWFPAMLYTAADFADYLDGYLARKTNQVTALGEALDLEWDALGMLLAFSLAVRYDVLPEWFLALGFARYLYSFAVGLRRRHGKPIYPLPPSDSRRPLAGLTMGFVSVMLWPIVPPDAALLAGTFFFAPFAAGFLRDGLVVTGVIDAEHPHYLQMRRWIKELFTRWAPIPARLALAWNLAPWIWGKFTNFSSFVRWYDGMGFPAPQLVVVTFGVIELAGWISAILGVAGRFAAFGLLFPVGFTIVGAGLSHLRATALASTLTLLIFGTGALSLWSPAAEILRRRGGPAEPG